MAEKQTEIEKKLEILEKAFQELQEENKKLKTKSSTRAKPSAAPKEEHNHEPEPQKEEPKHEIPTHFVKAYQPYCPECGEQNPNFKGFESAPDFKDELECADCHKPLGSLDNVKSLKDCPFCHSTKDAKWKK